MRIEIKLSSHDLSKLVHILEAADGLAVLKTIDGKKGLAELIFPAKNKESVEDMLKYFTKSKAVIKYIS